MAMLFLPKTWRLGGAARPMMTALTTIQIVDIILEGDGQQAMLSSYDVAGHVYAQITGFEMPAIAQIYGFKYVSSTADSAVAGIQLRSCLRQPYVQYCRPNSPSVNQAGSESLTSTVTATSPLEPNTSVSYRLAVPEMVNFTTTTVIDEEPPDFSI